MTPSPQSVMKVYLDNCCFNRPFDDQSAVRIRIESEAKLHVQQKIREEGSLVSSEDIEFLEHWLTEHILTADMKMGDYLAMQM